MNRPRGSLALPRLLAPRYKYALHALGGYLSESGRINFGRLSRLLQSLADEEPRVFQARSAQPFPGLSLPLRSQCHVLARPTVSLPLRSPCANPLRLLRCVATHFRQERKLRLEELKQRNAAAAADAERINAPDHDTAPVCQGERERERNCVHVEGTREEGDTPCPSLPRSS